jgi:hypothetical protein
MQKMLNHIKRNEIILIIIWALVQLFLLKTNGINTNGEATRFIREAYLLRNTGHFSTPIYFMYLTEISLITLKSYLNTGYSFIVILQLIINLFALVTFYYFINERYQSSKIALAAAVLMILCIPYQLYNVFIYTESIFFSLSIIFTCYLLRIKKFDLTNYAIIILMLVLLCLTRPSGMFFVGATIVYWFLFSTKSINFYLKLSVLMILVIINLFILNGMMGSGAGVDVLLPFKEEHIICDVATKLNNNPQDNISDNSILGLMNFIATHPSTFFKMGIKKTIAFFGLQRSYYSRGHNLFIASYFYCFYCLIIYGLIRFKKNIEAAHIYYLSLIGIFWLAVVFSCDEWHNRFFLTLTPMLILMCAWTLSKVIDYKK